MPIDLDPLLDKVWEACGQWIKGDAVLELYTKGQFLKDESLIFTESMPAKD